MKIKDFVDIEIDIPEEEILNILKEVYNRKRSAEYMAGTLIIGHNDHIIAFQPDDPLSNNVDYMVAKLYIQNKTPSHHYWGVCNTTVKEYESKGELIC